MLEKNTEVGREVLDPKQCFRFGDTASPDMGGRRKRYTLPFMANLQISLDKGVERVKSFTEEKYELLSYWRLYQMDLCNLLS